VAINGIEVSLTGGHPNSLGNTVAVVEEVLGDPPRLRELLDCYGSPDPVVRLRVSSALKRLSQHQPQWLVPHLDELLGTVAEIDQASTQWTLAILFERLEPWMTGHQRVAALDIMKRNLDNSDDWIVQNTTMQVVAGWSRDDADLTEWLRQRLERLSESPRKSVAARARRLLHDSGKRSDR
jgi:hypothetical protein